MALGATSQLVAQSNWTKLGPPPPAIQIIDEFASVTGSDHAFADIDNDGDQDVLLAGATFAEGGICRLYVNDGTGAFDVDETAPFVGVTNCAVAFADFDNDGDPDAVVTGADNANWSARLYINDGTGAFTLTGSPFQGVGYSTVAVEDVDDDADLDVFIGGQASSGVVSNLYMNDGNANFTINALASSTFPGIYFGGAEFGDIDGDSDADLILMGYGDSGSHSELFLNDGNAVFTIATSSFPTLNSVDIAFSDIDDDADLDVIISGNDPTLGPTTILYSNDGFGGLTVNTGSTFEQAGSASLDFGDIDNDGDDDLMIAGNTWTVGTITKIYTNDGLGVFTGLSGTTITAVSNGSSLFEDLDGDSDLDILVSGGYQAAMFTNDGNGIFTALPTTPFTGVTSGAISFADVDLDGDADVLITGQAQSGFSTKLYLNDGAGGYSFDNTNSFTDLANSAADFADIDGDDDLDLLISGYGTSQVTQLFTNDGNGVFTLVPSTPFPNFSSGAIEFNDVDNDGDQDVAMSGFIIFVGNVGQLWLNDGAGNFSLSTNNFEGANNGNIAFADIDGDEDEDLLMTGYGEVGRIAKLYTNDGAGIFTLIASPFPGVQQGAIDFADVDGDLDQDLVIAGEIGSSVYASQMYTNDGTGVFTLVAGTPFDPTITSGIIFSDIDNDLDPDLMTIGSSNNYQTIAKMYLNDGAGGFTLIAGDPFEGSSQGMMAFGDIDGDLDEDLIIAGNNGFNGIKTNLYRNDNCQQSNVIDTQLACGPYTWINGITYTTNNNTASMTFTNVGGCDSVVVLNLIIGDAAVVPTVLSLPTITAECEVQEITPPTASWNCSGLVTGTTTTVFPISGEGTTEITWIYQAPNGSTSTQIQQIVIHDVTSPVPDQANLPAYTTPCPIFTVPIIPTATDNCVGTILGTTADLPVTTPGTTTITWTFTDASGNSFTQTQDLIYTPLNNEVTFDGTTLTATQASASSYQWYDCNSETIIQSATSQTYNPTADGNYAVIITNNECEVTSDCFTITDLVVNELEFANISIYPNPNAGSFTIETSNAVSIAITNAAGQLVYSENLSGGKTEMNLKTLESGVYFVNSVHANGSQSIQKVSIVK